MNIQTCMHTCARAKRDCVGITRQRHRERTRITASDGRVPIVNLKHCISERPRLPRLRSVSQSVRLSKSCTFVSKVYVKQNTQIPYDENNIQKYLSIRTRAARHRTRHHHSLLLSLLAAKTQGRHTHTHSVGLVFIACLFRRHNARHNVRSTLRHFELSILCAVSKTVVSIHVHKSWNG